MGIPSNMDQLLTMRYLERANVGRILRPRDVNTPRCEAVLAEIQSAEVQGAVQQLLLSSTIVKPEEEFQRQLQRIISGNLDAEVYRQDETAMVQTLAKATA